MGLRNLIGAALMVVGVKGAAADQGSAIDFTWKGVDAQKRAHFTVKINTNEKILQINFKVDRFNEKGELQAHRKMIWPWVPKDPKTGDYPKRGQVFEETVDLKDLRSPDGWVPSDIRMSVEQVVFKKGSMPPKRSF